MKKNTRIVLLCAIVITVLAFALSTAASQTVQAEETSRGTTFNIYVTEENKTETVNETTYVAFFSISIENVGESLGDVTMYIEGFPNTKWEWQPNPGGSDHKIESVWPDTVKWVSLVIYAPLDATAGEYNLYMSVEPRGPSSEIRLTVIIPQKGGISVTAPGNLETEPGNKIELPFQILNEGNGEDTFTISRVDLSKPTWEADVVGGYKTTTVKPGYTVTKIIKVTVPYEAEATEPGNPGVRVSISVESDFDSSQQDGRGTYIKILQFWSLTFNVDKVNETTKPGERIDFQFIIRNDGNGQDNITISVEHTLPDWSIGLTKDWFNLSKDAGRQTTLTIIPSDFAVRGDYWMTVVATSSGPPGAPEEESQTLLITIEEVFNITMDIDKNTSDPMPPGGVAEYQFNVSNYGNTNDYVSMKVLKVPTGWAATLDNEGIPLSPAETKTITLTVLASPRLEESPAEEYFFSIKGVSEGAPDIINYINVSCEITPKGKIDFSLSGDDTLSANPFQKERYYFVFTVENKGNYRDEISLDVSSTSWNPDLVHIDANFLSPLVPVAFNSEKEVSIEVFVPKNTPQGYYDINVIAISSLNPESTKSLIVHIKVIREDVIVQPLKFKKGNEQDFRIWQKYIVEEGETVNIGVPIFNNGSEVIKRVNVKVFQGSKVIKEQNITSLGVLKTLTITVQWPADFLGEFNIKATASIQGDAYSYDNKASAKIKVKEETEDGGGEEAGPFDLTPGSPLFYILLIVIVVAILGTVRYLMGLRSEQTTKDLYESIYGGVLLEEEGGAPGEGLGGQTEQLPGDEGGGGQADTGSDLYSEYDQT